MRFPATTFVITPSKYRSDLSSVSRFHGGDGGSNPPGAWLRSSLAHEAATPRGRSRSFRFVLLWPRSMRNLQAAVARHFAHDDLVRVHKSLRVTPAMAAGCRGPLRLRRYDLRGHRPDRTISTCRRRPDDQCRSTGRHGDPRTFCHGCCALLRLMESSSEPNRPQLNGHPADAHETSQGPVVLLQITRPAPAGVHPMVLARPPRRLRSMRLSRVWSLLRGQPQAGKFRAGPL
jgi:hypothetical protein